MLVLSRKPLERIQIGENITITVLHTKGKVVKLGIDAPRNMRILRTELTTRDTTRDEVGGDREKAVSLLTPSATPTEDEPAGEDEAGGTGAYQRTAVHHGDRSAGKAKKRTWNTGLAGPRRGTIEEPCGGGRRPLETIK